MHDAVTHKLRRLKPWYHSENASLFDVPGLGSALAQEELAAQDLAKMIPVLDSFAHAMDLEGTVAYDPEDPAFVWTELYLLGVNWYTDGQLDAPASDAITVPVEQMQEYAAASFAGMEELPEFPAVPQYTAPVRSLPYQML